jgi:hypothetical protein
MNAPLLIKITNEDLEKIRYDPIKIAEVELRSGTLPISVKRPFPEKREGELKRLKETKISDEKIEEKEASEEEEIVKEGEIMALANPDDEVEEVAGAEEESGED